MNKRLIFIFLFLVKSAFANQDMMHQVCMNGITLKGEKDHNYCKCLVNLITRYKDNAKYDSELEDMDKVCSLRQEKADYLSRCRKLKGQTQKFCECTYKELIQYPKYKAFEDMYYDCKEY